MPDQKPRHNVHSIAAERPFLDVLAGALMRRHETAPESLSDMVILLPTRRAVRSLTEAFLRANDGASMLLPRMAPIGDLDQADLPPMTLLGAAGLDADIPPAMPPMRRRLILARLVLARQDMELSPDQALMLADSLASLLDSIHTEGCNPADLEHLVPMEADYAKHWQITLKFLQLVTEVWPKILAEEGMLDAAERRNRMLRAQAAAWRAAPPGHSVMIAGVTGSIPAVAELMAVAAKMSGGEVILPGLDRGLDEESWAALSPSHPQFAMRGFLSMLGLGNGDVQEWEAEAEDKNLAALPRGLLMREVMRPAATAGKWQDMGTLSKTALRGLHRITAPDAESEARCIALILRRALETPGRTAALITPDRSLASRVSASLMRWGVVLDDSAGRSLLSTEPGNFLCLVAEAAASALHPVPLLAALKHPLARMGMADAKTLHDHVKSLERHVLRGPRPAAGFLGLKARLAEVLPDMKDTEAMAGISALLAGMEARMIPFIEALAADSISPRQCLERHLALAESMAQDDMQSGANRLWLGHDGEGLAAYLRDLMDHLDHFPAIRGADYPALIRTLLAGELVHAPYGSHPRLHILGPMEARLQAFDITILGGLNEGAWPREAVADPWMSRQMRRDFGLPPPEQHHGFAAHDFASAMAAQEVYLTRALRVDGTPQLPSRWLERLDAVMEAGGIDPAALEDSQWLDLAVLMDEAEEDRPMARPAPRPPVDVRPDYFSLSDIELLRRDPYGFYAKRILGLKPLDDLDADPGAAERGSFIHAALEDFLRAYPAQLPEDAHQRLMEMGRKAFGDALSRPEVRALWWPRFERIAGWFLEQEEKRRAYARPAGVEIAANWQLRLDDGSGAHIHARADRIDCVKSEGGEGYEIIDYKTGGVPSKKEIEAGYAPQLALEAAMLEDGAFADLPAGEVAAISYWKLLGLETAGEIRRYDLKKRDYAAEAREGIFRMLSSYRDPQSAYPAIPYPEFSPRHSDYDHLGRWREWSVIGDEEGGE